MSCVCVTSSPCGKRSARSALAAWKLRHGDAEAVGIAADLVQREQPQVAVEGGVLDPLRGDRRRGLLKARHELRVLGRLDQQQRVRQRLIESRLAHGATVLLGHQAAPRLDVGAVDGQRRERAGERARVERAEPLQARELSGEGACRLLELRLERDLVEPASLARDLGEQPCERLAPGRVDEQRTGVVEELVADRARHRPVAQGLGWVGAAQDLLHPHLLDALGREPAQVARGVGEAIGMVDAQAARAAPRGTARAPCGGIPRRPPHPPGGSRPCRRCRRSACSHRPDRGRTSAAKLRVRPPAVLLAGAHVVRDDVEDHAEPGRGELAELPPRRPAPR